MCGLIKPGGLDSQDQWRLRFLDPSRSTFETYQDYPYWLFFVSSKIFEIKTFESRLICIKILIEIVETNPDCQDFSRNIDISQHLSRSNWPTPITHNLHHVCVSTFNAFANCYSSVDVISLVPSQSDHI
jgi:hypothetical protein